MKKIGVFIAALMVFPLGFAALRVANPFTDHMVLQAGKPVAVWGLSDPGQQVTVSFANQKVDATADESGFWKAFLTSLPYSKNPDALIIEAGDEKCTFSDVLVGEVWLCSGQSNMEFSLAHAENSAKEIETADYPDIRLFIVEHKLAGEPQTTLTARNGGWQKCSPQTAGGFSAAGYFFGRKLHEELDVPIGLIQSAWGGTRIEAWIDWSRMASDPVCGYLLPPWQELISKTSNYYQNFQMNVQEFDRAVRETAEAKKSWEARKRQAIQSRILFREPMPQDPPLLTPGNKHTPSAIYNAMIAPLAPYALRGAIWYQGESNSARSPAYRHQLPLLISNWRDLWKDPEMQVYIVQLPNYGPEQRDPLSADEGFAALREAQLYTVQTVSNTALAVTIDIGEADNVHPKNKQEAGRRLALPALNRLYGKPCEDSGPVYESMEKDGGSLWVNFSHAEGLQAKKGAVLQGFVLYSESTGWVWADARIVGSQVQLTASGMTNPTAARYNWDRNPVGNLVNSAGLPAGPFRTDSRMSGPEQKDNDMIDSYIKSKK